MFTGIIETTGTVTKIEVNGSNTSFWIQSSLTPELKVDQSLAHNGVCLTVEDIKNDVYKVTAIYETLQKTNLGGLQVGNTVNLERCLVMNGRLDGHFVQGHVDTTGTVQKITPREGSWEFDIAYPAEFAALLIEKGSVAMNGVSLTVFNVGRDGFRVAIIPYTYEHTGMKGLKEGDVVNLEFDVVGKYILRREELKK